MKKDEIYYIPQGSPVAPDKFDIRVQLRNRSRGVITPDELKKHIQSLPDDTNSAVFIDFEAVVHEEKEAGVSPPVPGLTH